MLQGLREVKLPAGQWGGDILLLRPTPLKGDPWGILAPLKGTPWAEQIPVIGGDLFSHALHGRTMPLIKQLGAGPKAAMLRMAGHGCTLRDGKKCIVATAFCQPGDKVPECYIAPLDDPAASRAATVVALAWRKGYHVIVVTEEGEFKI